MIVTNEQINPSDIPGFDNLIEKGYNDCISYIKNNLDKPAICLQIIDTKQPSKIAHDENGDLFAAYGWKCVQALGKGKDGTTFWGYKYGDTKEEKSCTACKQGRFQDNREQANCKSMLTFFINEF